MPSNPNWPRWIFASIAKVLKQIATDNSIPVLIEHLDERNDSFQKAPDRAEIRITGPFVTELSQGYFRAYVDVNVLLTSHYGGTAKHGYDILRLAGLFQEAMSKNIAVWNYGDQAGDFTSDSMTQVTIGCLEPRPEVSESIRVFNLGQTDRTVKQKQSVVEARYVLFLTN